MDDRELWEAYAWPERCVRVNFVTTIDGQVTGPDGRSGSLSSSEDRRIFHMLRAGADAILVGAGTARIEQYRKPAVKPEWLQFRGSSEPPVLIMVTRTGNVPDIEGAITVDGTDLAAVTNDYPRILCEGGRTSSPHFSNRIWWTSSHSPWTAGSAEAGACSLLPSLPRPGPSTSTAMLTAFTRSGRCGDRAHGVRASVFA